MSTSGMSLRAVFMVFAVCLIGSTPTYSQSRTNLVTGNSPSLRLGSRAWLAKCPDRSLSALAGAHWNDRPEWLAAEVEEPWNSLAADSKILGAPGRLCAESTLPSPKPQGIDNPCGEYVGGSPGLAGVSRNPNCNDAQDTILPELFALGKPGEKIVQARQGVLAILRSDNACTEWFTTKDATPAATFQSLSFALDKNGPERVFESYLPGSVILWRQPYVASAIQDGGAHTAITINANGAFYRQQGNVVKVLLGGGPVIAHGTRYLSVGSYDGNTLPARIVTLLHEFGHIIDLLPEDADNLDGKSVKNTDEVLRHCRDEVEAESHPAKQTAKR